MKKKLKSVNMPNKSSNSLTIIKQKFKIKLKFNLIISLLKEFFLIKIYKLINLILILKTFSKQINTFLFQAEIFHKETILKNKNLD